MFFKLRTFLVIFLALLQFIAPLVHAHAGEENHVFTSGNPGKLHIPGLESYGNEPSPLTLKAEKQHINSYGVEGIAIGIDVGIKDKQDKQKNDKLHHYLLPKNNFIKLTFSSPSILVTHPTLPPFMGRQLVSSDSPRAPPAA